MSLIKFTKNRWPWNYGLTDFLERKDFLGNSPFDLEKSLPAMNVKEHEKGFEIEFALPGFDKKDFQITLKGNILEVTAIKSKEGTEENGDYTCREFNYHSFERIVQLPNTIDGSKEVGTTYRNGILKVNLLKKEEAVKKPKKRLKLFNP